MTTDDNGLTFPAPTADVTSVTSLDDRRKIKSLEKQVAELTHRLTEALGNLKPQLERSIGDCRHFEGYWVSDNTPKVSCKKCGEAVDPYVVLRQIAHREVSFCYRSNELRAEKDRLLKEVERLKGQRGRLRAQVTKLTPDTPMDDIVAAMDRAGADSFLVRRIGGQWGAWFYSLRTAVAQTPAVRSLREAVSRIVADSDAQEAQR